MPKATMDALQIGRNVDSTKNCHLRSNNDGTFTLARGNVGAPLSDILTIGASGRVVMPQNRYVSGNQAITSGGLLVLPHGLGAEPSQIFLYLKCLTAQAGFTVGQKIVAQMQLSTAADDNRGASVIVDATNISVRFGVNASPFATVNFTGGGGQDLTNANWAFVVEAFA